jgi:23S rRNA (pseudouridine1915-N3)-methyltransferase
MKLLILAVGRLRDRGLQSLIDDYVRRTRHHLPIEVREVKSTQALLARVPKRFLTVALDERGKQVTTRQLAADLQRHMQSGTGGIAYLIGGAEGLGEEIRSRADVCLALSRLTLPHRLARVVLCEQLYRAVTIIRGEPYHK